MKKFLKISGIVAGILILIIACVTIFSSGLVKAGLRTAGPALVGVPMDLGSLTFNPFTGRMVLRDLQIGNPPDYQNQYAFILKKFVLDIDMSTVFSRKLVIEQIMIEGVNLNYETNFIDSNLNDILKKLDREKSEKQLEPEKESRSKPLQVNDLQLHDITAHLILGQTIVQIPVMLPPVSLQNLGTDPQGITSAMVLNDILTSLLSGLTKEINTNAALRSLSSAVTATANSLDSSIDSTSKFLKKGVSSAAGYFQKGLNSTDRSLQKSRETTKKLFQ